MKPAREYNAVIERAQLRVDAALVAMTSASPDQLELMRLKAHEALERLKMPESRGSTR